MNREIKTLLKLARIPGFVLTEKEQAILNAWKESQEPVEIKAPKKQNTRKKKTTNEVKVESKEIGELEIDNPISQES